MKNAIEVAKEFVDDYSELDLLKVSVSVLNRLLVENDYLTEKEMANALRDGVSSYRRTHPVVKKQTAVKVAAPVKADMSFVEED